MADGVGTTHHVNIGGLYYLVLPNSYRKRAAPVFGARFSSGDPDYTNLSFWQHWAQECWIGGAGQEDWDDDAMYDQGVGVDTTNHQAILLARDLGRNAGNGWGVGSSADGNRVRQFVKYAGDLYCVNVSGSDDGQVYKYTPSTDTWSLWVTSGGVSIRSASQFAENFVLGTTGSSLRRFDGSSWTGINKPSGVSAAPYAMRSWKSRLYVAFGRHIWKLKPNWDWDANTEFAEVAGADRIIAMEFHRGMLYMMSNNGVVVRTNGDTLEDLFSWDGSMRGIGLKSYDGKLFVSTFEYNEDPDLGEGVLYQFTDSAVTELKRWGRVGRATSPGRMTTHARKLYYGASDLLGMSQLKTGFGIAVYDSVEDAHSIYASNRDNVSYPDAGEGRAWQVDDVIHWGGYLMCSVRGHGLFKTRVTHRDVSRFLARYDTSAVGAPMGADNAGWITSSEFDAGTPGLMKLWRRIAVHADFPSIDTTIRVSYSIDGGVTWVFAKTLAWITGSPGHMVHHVYLENVIASRFKWKLQLDSFNPVYTPVVRSVVVSYLPVPEPNWQWDMTLVLANKVTLLDGTERDENVDALRWNLEDMFRNKMLAYFQDIDGAQYMAGHRGGVFVSDLAINLPFLGPWSDGAREGTAQITMIEAVEEYETAVG